MAMLVVTHNLALEREVADAIAVLDAGDIVWSGGRGAHESGAASRTPELLAATPRL
jgi:ABC-type glutathione transport system ATPase component